MGDGYWLNRYECPRQGCGKHHKNGSKAQAACESKMAARKAKG